MKRKQHSTPLRVAQVALALLVALAASTAAGQTRSAAVPPAAPGPSYGPVLHPQPVTAEPGLAPAPAAAPLPQATGPATLAPRKDGKPPARRMGRHSAPQRVDPVPLVGAGPFLPPAAPPPPQPVALVPGPAQINSCLGGSCTDTSGATYNTGVGNAAVNGQGRLCTRSGNTMQCF